MGDLIFNNNYIVSDLLIYKKSTSASKTVDSIEIAFYAVESILMKYFVYIHVVFVQVKHYESMEY